MSLDVTPSGQACGHRWEPDMLVMWDNRSVLHMATGGYDGHERLLHRTTIAGVAPLPSKA